MVARSLAEGIAEGDDPGSIFTVGVSQLAESSPDVVLGDIQNRTHRFNWFNAYAWTIGILFLLLLAAPPAAFALLMISLVPGFYLFRWNRDRRTARLFYDVDNEILVHRLAMCNAVGEALSKSSHLWHIYSSIATNDAKRNAGASALIRRTRISCTRGSLPGIELNVEPWRIAVGPQQLLFLPDRLLVHERSQFAAVPYEYLDCQFATTRFIEEGGIPSDSRQVDTTWRYVNKSGGPDRRFNNNRQIPVLEYGSLILSTPSGMKVVLQMSSPACGGTAAQALVQLRPVTYGAVESTDARTITPPIESQSNRAASPVVDGTQSAFSAPQRSELAVDRRVQQFVMPQPESLLLAAAASSVATSQPTSVAPLAIVLLRYVAAADGKISQEEINFISTSLTAVDSPAPVSALTSHIRELKSGDADAEQAARYLIATRPELAPWVIQIATQLANTDGRFTPKERERLAQLASWLRA